MSKYFMLFFCASFLFCGCSLPDDTIPNQEQDFVILQEMFAEIVAITDIPCTDASDWDFVAYGSKACGGPQGYIAYPTTVIDVDAFLSMVEDYTLQEQVYNEIHGIVSTCDVPAEPIGVICENGAPVLLYE